MMTKQTISSFLLSVTCQRKWALGQPGISVGSETEEVFFGIKMEIQKGKVTNKNFTSYCSGITYLWLTVFPIPSLLFITTVRILTADRSVKISWWANLKYSGWSLGYYQHLFTKAYYSLSVEIRYTFVEIMPQNMPHHNMCVKLNVVRQKTESRNKYWSG